MQIFRIEIRFFFQSVKKFSGGVIIKDLAPDKLARRSFSSPAF